MYECAVNVCIQLPFFFSKLERYPWSFSRAPEYVISDFKKFLFLEFIKDSRQQIVVARNILKS